MATIENGVLRGGFLWVNVREGRRVTQHRLNVIPEPRTILRSFTGWTWRQILDNEIEVSPALCAGGKTLTEHRWRLCIIGELPKPEPERPAVDYVTDARKAREADANKTAAVMRRMGF